MTVSSQVSSVQYLGDGVTTLLPVPYYFLEQTHLTVTRINLDGSTQTLVLGSDYSVAGAGNQAGGSVTMFVAPILNVRIIIDRTVPATQETDYVANDPFPAESHERALDKLTMLVQQAGRDISGAIRVAVGDPEPNRLPVASERANLLMGFDSNGDPISVAPVNGSASDLAMSLASFSDSNKGAGQVGYSDSVTYPANTVGKKISDLDDELDSAVIDIQDQINQLVRNSNHPAIISNSASAVAKNVTVVGDSISHGAFALNTFMHGWARVFHRMVNADLLASNYGFANWATVGSGPTASTEIHNVSFGGGSWSGIDVTSLEASYSPIGSALRSPGVGGTMTFGVPFFQNLGEIHYLQQPGGGTFTITVNGVLAATVNTNGALSHQVSAFNLTDAGYGNVVIVVEQTVVGLVDIISSAYNSPGGLPVFNNYSQSGRRARYMSEYIIGKLMAESSTYVFALGHNDQGTADSDNTYYAAFVQVINWHIQYAKQFNVKVVVPDFCWTAPENSRARAELQRLAKETGGIYINLPKMIFSGDVAISTTYLIDTLKMWTDGSHPNKDGHKWIAETVARAMGLSCTSKRDAMRLHDFWMPLPLQAATGVENGNTVSASLSSAYKRNGNEVIIKVFAENATSGAFPVGVYALTTAFNAKSELALAQGETGIAYLRNDTGAVVSGYSITSGGALTLNVYSAFINDQIFSFNSPIAPGTL